MLCSAQNHMNQAELGIDPVHGTREALAVEHHRTRAPIHINHRTIGPIKKNEGAANTHARTRRPHSNLNTHPRTRRPHANLNTHAKTNMPHDHLHERSKHPK